MITGRAPFREVHRNTSEQQVGVTQELQSEVGTAPMERAAHKITSHSMAERRVVFKQPSLCFVLTLNLEHFLISQHGGCLDLVRILL